MKDYLQVRIDTKIKEQFRQLAEEQNPGLPKNQVMSAVVREMIVNYIKGNGGNKMKLEETIRNAETIEIISGEGDQGTAEVYGEERTLRALYLRLKVEECDGDRWAYARIDGVRYDVKGDTLEPRY